MLTDSLWDWVCPTHDPTHKMGFPSGASQRDADTELSPRERLCPERFVANAAARRAMENAVKIGIRIPAARCALLVALLLRCTSAFAQAPEKEPEEIAAVELGGAAERSLTEGNSSFGPTAAVEFTPIEHWLEIEAGVTLVFRRHSTEWSVDLLFKKPSTISSKFEFMLAIGPEWIHTDERANNANKMNAAWLEVAPDFMFWPAKKHKFGWYCEPRYSYKFGRSHEHSPSVSGGLLVSIP
jgi:hypothetical protein